MLTVCCALFQTLACIKLTLCFVQLFVQLYDFLERQYPIGKMKYYTKKSQRQEKTNVCVNCRVFRCRTIYC
jgi:hypothetical protein